MGARTGMQQIAMLPGKVDFDLCSAIPPRLSEDKPRRKAWDRLLSKCIRPLVDKQIYGGRYVIDLDSPKLPLVVDQLEQLRKDRLLGAFRATIAFRLPRPEVATWYLVIPQCDDHLAEWEPFSERGMPTLDTVGAKGSRHVTASENGTVYVDRTARSFIEGRKLTGLRFLWMQPNGRSRRPLTLYLPIPQQTLGRGLDHPWVDPKKVAAHKSYRIPALWRYGIYHFDSAVTRDDISFGDATKDRLLQMLDRRDLVVSGPRAFLRRQVPKSDFAFVWDKPDVFRPYGPESGAKEGLQHSRQLCVNRKTKQLLIEAGFLRDRDFEPVLILDRPWQGTSILGGHGPAPSPLLSTLDLRQSEDAERAYSQRRWPESARDLDSLTSRLERLCDQKRQKRRQGSSDSAIAKAERLLKMRIPSAWQRVLKSASGLRISKSDLGPGATCEIMPASQLPAFQRIQREAMKAFEIRFDRPVLHVVDNGIGDFICLDTTRTKSGDCAVLLLSHETGRVERRWNRVEGMLEDLLAGSE